MALDASSSYSPAGSLLAVVLVTTLAAGACATTQGGAPRPFPTPGGDASTQPGRDSPGAATLPGRIPPSSSGSTGGWLGLIETALGLRGVPYRWGGSDLSGFDCSGFTQYVFARHGVALPREVGDQYRLGRPIRARDVQPGDLIFFTTTARGASHVAIALGGDEFVHAPSSTGVVRVEKLNASYWSRRFVGARRIEQQPESVE